MGLTSTVQNAVTIAFNSLGDLKVSYSITTGQTETYNPSTGLNVMSAGTTKTGEGVLVGINNNDLHDTTIRSSIASYQNKDVGKFLMPNISEEVDSNDEITIDGNLYKIASVSKDPTKSLLTLIVWKV